MPFKSMAQEHFMYSQHPRIAAKWAGEFGAPKELPQTVESDLKQQEPRKRGQSAWMNMKPHTQKEGY